MYVWCTECNEYRKNNSDVWWKCKQAKHIMHDADDKFQEEIDEVNKKIKRFKKSGIEDQESLGRLGVLMATQNADQKPKDTVDKADLILSEIVEKYSITGEGDNMVYFWIQRDNGSYDALPHDDERLIRLLLRKYKQKYGKVLNRVTALQAIQSHTAEGDVPENTIANVGKRIMKVGDTLWVDLRDPKNSIYSVTPEHRGPPYPYSPDLGILFTRDGGLPMPMPERDDDRDWLKWFSELLRIPKDIQMLFIVHVCHLFCVWQETPFMMFVGPERSGKTVTAAMVKELVDPVGLNSTSNTLPKDEAKLSMMLTRELAQLFDNVSYIPQPISDMLCQACTGGVFSARELYTTSSMRTIPFRKMRILMTSIVRDAIRTPDLASRTLLYDVPPGQKDAAKDDIEAKYKKNRAHVLYAVLDTVGRAMMEYEARKNHYSNLPTTTRMVEFERFGSAIAHVLGDREYKSIKDYQGIMSDNVAMMVADDPLVVLIEKIFEMDQVTKYFELTSVFYQRIHEIAESETIDTRGKDFPNTIVALRKGIDRLRGALLQRGFEVTVGKRYDVGAKEKHRSHITIVYKDHDGTNAEKKDHPIMALIEKVLKEDQTTEYFDLTEVFHRRIMDMAEAESINTNTHDFPNTILALRKCIEMLNDALLQNGYSVDIKKIHDSSAKKKHHSHIRITYKDTGKKAKDATDEHKEDGDAEMQKDEHDEKSKGGTDEKKKDEPVRQMRTSV